MTGLLPEVTACPGADHTRQGGDVAASFYGAKNPYVRLPGKLYGTIRGADQVVSPTFVTDKKWRQVALISDGLDIGASAGDRPVLRRSGGRGSPR